MTLNMPIPEELNEERKKLGVTWREVITVGLATIQKDPSSVPLDRSYIETELKKARDGVNNILKLVQTSDAKK